MLPLAYPVIVSISKRLLRPEQSLFFWAKEESDPLWPEEMTDSVKADAFTSPE